VTHGTYGVKREYRDTSMKIGKPVFNRVVGCDAGHYAMTARWPAHQIESGVEGAKPPTHPLKLLRMAYGI